MGEIVSCPCMDGECTAYVGSWGSHRLESLAERLRSYKPVVHDHPSFVAEEQEVIDGGTGGSHHQSNLSQSFAGMCDHLSNGNGDHHHLSMELRRAAVLICLFEGDEGELRVILTQRSDKLSTHPGEVALPGGKMEEGDIDESATALRETMEEIGLDSSSVHVVALLEPFISKHLLKVTPVVGLLANRNKFKPLLNTGEVNAIFDVPLDIFLKEEKHRIEEKDWMGWKYFLHLFDFESDQGKFLIWGLTAGILIKAASVIYQRSPLFKPPSPDFQQLQRILMSQL